MFVKEDKKMLKSHPWLTYGTEEYWNRQPKGAFEAAVESLKESGKPFKSLEAYPHYSAQFKQAIQDHNRSIEEKISSLK